MGRKTARDLGCEVGPVSCGSLRLPGRFRPRSGLWFAGHRNSCSLPVPLPRRVRSTHAMKDETMWLKCSGALIMLVVNYKVTPCQPQSRVRSTHAMKDETMWLKCSGALIMLVVSYKVNYTLPTSSRFSGHRASLSVGRTNRW